MFETKIRIRIQSSTTTNDANFATQLWFEPPRPIFHRHSGATFVLLWMVKRRADILINLIPWLAYSYSWIIRLVLVSVHAPNWSAMMKKLDHCGEYIAVSNHDDKWPATCRACGSVDCDSYWIKLAFWLAHTPWLIHVSLLAANLVTAVHAGIIDGYWISGHTWSQKNWCEGIQHNWVFWHLVYSPLRLFTYRRDL